MNALAVLVVYAYSSFVASWGPGPTLASAFEKQCHCKVKLVDAGDGGTLLGRLKLEGEKSPADILLGVDRTTLAKIREEQKWNVNIKAFDYGPYAFVYNSKEVQSPPKSLDDLLDPKWKGQILLEDPRLSSTGIGFLLWVIKEKGEDQAWDYLKRLKPQLKMITPSWDLAYGLFKKNQGKLVFSYWTSPAYHIQEEKRHDIKAAPFANGNYFQTEFILNTPGEKNKSLKQKFIEFVLSEKAQKEMPLKNFMFPINKKAKLPPAFKEIGTVKELPPLLPSSQKLDEWLNKWREIFS
jgi:thiamine transport system substrate-binding protein